MTSEARLRCPSTTVGIAVAASGTFRVRCKGKFCKAPDGKVTFHIFDLATGILLRTEHVPYRDPSELLGLTQVKESA